jgi:GT2 family glycosyltransferase
MVSIIIAVKGFNDFLKEALQKCLKLVYQDYEIIVLPDEVFDYQDPRVRIIPTGSCLPAKKRNIGSSQAKGEILAFLDDDAYPVESWLTNALKNFEDTSVAAVGGPAVTPPTDDLLRRASGEVYESLLVSGNFRYRYRKGKKQFVDDYPSCNFLVRKDVFEQIGGFGTNFWPGEDTHLCLEITKRLKKKIVYDPEVLVFHHRRPLFLPHLRQITNYAQHRGYFVKRFPQTSLRWQYFVPSLFLMWLIVGMPMSLFNGLFALFYFVTILGYLIILIAASYDERHSEMLRYVAWGIFLTHICYGYNFILGLCKPRLSEEGEI